MNHTCQLMGHQWPDYNDLIRTSHNPWIYYSEQKGRYRQRARYCRRCGNSQEENLEGYDPNYKDSSWDRATNLFSKTEKLSLAVIIMLFIVMFGTLLYLGGVK